LVVADLEHASLDEIAATAGLTKGAMATTYRIRLAPGETTNMLRPTNGAVLVIIAGTAHLQLAGANDAGIPPGESRTNEITSSGSTQWIEGGSVVRLHNAGRLVLTA